MADFNQAVEWLREGKKIVRNSNPNYYIRVVFSINEDSKFLDSNREQVHFTLSDFCYPYWGLYSPLHSCGKRDQIGRWLCTETLDRTSLNLICEHAFGRFFSEIPVKACPFCGYEKKIMFWVELTNYLSKEGAEKFAEWAFGPNFRAMERGLEFLTEWNILHGKELELHPTGHLLDDIPKMIELWRRDNRETWGN